GVATAGPVRPDQRCGEVGDPVCVQRYQGIRQAAQAGGDRTAPGRAAAGGTRGRSHSPDRRRSSREAGSGAVARPSLPPRSGHYSGQLPGGPDGRGKRYAGRDERLCGPRAGPPGASAVARTGGELRGGPTMSDRDNQERLDRLAMRYLAAIDSGDFDAIDALWDQSEADPELGEMLHGLHAALVEDQDAQDAAGATAMIEA